MNFDKDLMAGNMSVERDIPVYDSAALDFHELLMLGTTGPDTGDDAGAGLVTAYTGTEGNQGVDAVGILNEGTYALGGTVPGGDLAPTTASISTSLYYGKVITNPFAVYRAEYLQGTSNDTAITTTSGTTLTIGSLSDDINYAAWFYFPLSASTAQFRLRYITGSASGSCTMDSALSADGTSADTVIRIGRINNYINSLSTNAVSLDSDDFAGKEEDGANFLCLDNLIKDDVGRPYQLLGSHPTRGEGDRVHGTNHRGLGPLDPTTKFYCRMIMLDRLFSPGD